MERYEYWLHGRTGEHYLVRFDGAGLITGVCGPLRQSHIPMENWHNYDYDAQPKYTAWLRLHMAEFQTLAPVVTSPRARVLTGQEQNGPGKCPVWRPA